MFSATSTRVSGLPSCRRNSRQRPQGGKDVLVPVDRHNFFHPVFSGGEHGGNSGVLRAETHAAGGVDANAPVHVALVGNQGGGYAACFHVRGNPPGLQHLQGGLIELCEFHRGYLLFFQEYHSAKAPEKPGRFFTKKGPELRGGNGGAFCCRGERPSLISQKKAVFPEKMQFWPWEITQPPKERALWAREGERLKNNRTLPRIFHGNPDLESFFCRENYFAVGKSQLTFSFFPPIIVL